MPPFQQTPRTLENNELRERLVEKVKEKIAGRVFTKSERAELEKIIVDVMAEDKTEEKVGSSIVIAFRNYIIGVLIPTEENLFSPKKKDSVDYTPKQPIEEIRQKRWDLRSEDKE
ncbi:MAG: hypothetical protein QG653_610 [Patescibacteria group bacterium]|nr:hypothetical protein [Patescibacteria group bacterium]